MNRHKLRGKFYRGFVWKGVVINIDKDLTNSEVHCEWLSGSNKTILRKSSTAPSAGITKLSVGPTSQFRIEPFEVAFACGNVACIIYLVENGKKSLPLLAIDAEVAELK